jgi:hypothetical protein
MPVVPANATAVIFTNITCPVALNAIKLEGPGNTEGVLVTVLPSILELIL